MGTLDKTIACPCGEGKAFGLCCEPFIAGTAAAPTPEKLMRSRYTAFYARDFAYLERTWHPDTRPTLTGDEPSGWVGLEIIESWEEGDEGEVEFKAKLIHDGKLETLHERSEFDKIDGKWFYHSGEFLNESGHVQKIKKSQPCPCGSGKLFKNCHLKS